MTVTFDGQPLVKDTDYTVAVASGSASNGTNAEVVTLTFTGVGNYTGTKEVTYTINKAVPAGAPSITASITQSGKTLADAGLFGCFTHNGVRVPGSLSWNEDAAAIVLRGTAYGWTFTPDDPVNYAVVTSFLTPYPKRSSGGGATVPRTAAPTTVSGDTWYTGYPAAAKRIGVSKGTGDNKFAPETTITRQEMFTMLYNVLKALDKLPQGDSGKTLSGFSDSGSVSHWAKEAMTVLVKSGTVSGANGKLAPRSAPPGRRWRRRCITFWHSEAQYY